MNEFARSYYIRLIKNKYGKQAEKMVSLMMDIFNGDELDLIISGDLSDTEKEFYLDRIKKESNEELTNFIEGLLTSTVKEFEDDEDDGNGVYKLLAKQKKREQLFYYFASSFAALGLVALLIILTIRITALPYLTNLFTVIAFLSVIINILLKEYYKSNSLKSLDNQKKELLSDLKQHNSEE